MRIALFNWRDLRHPKAGGAEYSTDRLAAGLARRGHTVTWFTSTYPDAAPLERRNGYDVIRRGSELSCRFFALRWLHRHRAHIDLVIDEVNTLPFLSHFVFPKRVVLWIHQLAREVWFAEAPAPLSHIGHALEPAFLRLYADVPVMTVSESSARSLREIGLRGPIEVIVNPLMPAHADPPIPKVGRIGFIGRLAPSKRIDHIIQALAIVARSVPEAELLIAGAGHPREVARLTEIARRAGVGDRVRLLGRLSTKERDAFIAGLDVLAMASLREGWGLVVSEAARFYVPAAVYPVAGLIDSVRHEHTGLIADEQTPEALAAALTTIIRDRPLRARLGKAAAEYVRQYPEERFVAHSEKTLRKIAAVSI